MSTLALRVLVLKKQEVLSSVKRVVVVTRLRAKRHAEGRHELQDPLN